MTQKHSQNVIIGLFILLVVLVVVPEINAYEMRSNNLSRIRERFSESQNLDIGLNSNGDGENGFSVTLDNGDTVINTETQATPAPTPAPTATPQPTATPKPSVSSPISSGIKSLTGGFNFRPSFTSPTTSDTEQDTKTEEVEVERDNTEVEIIYEKTTTTSKTETTKESTYESDQEEKTTTTSSPFSGLFRPITSILGKWF